MSDPDTGAAEAWPSPEEKARSIAQAKALRSQAKAGGLRFDAYLPPSLADWLLGLVEDGVFADPREAAFVIFGEHRELAQHRDLRRELLSRSLQEAMDDPQPGIPADAVLDRLQKSLASRREPAVWKK